jgi:hypothetical protein
MVTDMDDEERKRLSAEVDGLCAEVDEMTTEVKRIDHEVIKEQHMARFGRVQPQRSSPESVEAAARHSPDAKQAAMDPATAQAWNDWADARIEAALAAERETTERRIGEAIKASRHAIGQIEHVFERIQADMAIATAGRKAAIEAVRARYDALEARFAELRALVASNGVTVIDGTPLTRSRNVN